MSFVNNFARLKVSGDFKLRYKTVKYNKTNSNFIFSVFQNNPPQVVQDKILSLIQDWADAFRSSPDLSYVMETYETLRAQGWKIGITQARVWRV